jgi:hypothetical protein
MMRNQMLEVRHEGRSSRKLDILYGQRPELGWELGAYIHLYRTNEDVWCDYVQYCVCITLSSLLITSDVARQVRPAHAISRHPVTAPHGIDTSLLATSRS